MLSPLQVATHWPYVASQMRPVARSRDGKSAMPDQVLRLLAERQVLNLGDPVALSRSALASGLGMTPGQGGRAWWVLSDLEDRGVVFHYRSRGGRTPALWSFAPALARWRVEWQWSAREPESVVMHCSCRALFAFAARNPGQGLVSPRVIPVFDLPPELHLGLRGEFRAADDEARAACSPVARENVEVPRGKDGAYTSLLGGNYPLPLREGMGRLKEVIRVETGCAVFGSAEADLAEAVGLSGIENVEELARELAVAIRGLEAAPVCARRALALAPVVSGRAHERQSTVLEGDRRQLAIYEANGAGDEPAALVLRERLGILEGDATK
jgi:hypothetical protein